MCPLSVSLSLCSNRFIRTEKELFSSLMLFLRHFHFIKSLLNLLCLSIACRLLYSAFLKSPTRESLLPKRILHRCYHLVKTSVTSQLQHCGYSPLRASTRVILCSKHMPDHLWVYISCSELQSEHFESKGYFLSYYFCYYFYSCISVNWISSVQLGHSVMSDSLPPHESQHTRPPCPSPSPGLYSNSCP